MKTIWKWPLQPEVSINMPKDAKLLRVETQAHQPCLWALVDPDAPLEKRSFKAYGTGHKTPDDPGEYVGTFQIAGMVFHVFEEKEAQ